MRCHLDGVSAVSTIFCRPSCTLFSPNSRWPAAHASRTRSTPNVFETATRVTSDAARPDRRAASAMRPRTSARFSAIDTLQGSRFTGSQGSRVQGSRVHGFTGSGVQGFTLEPYFLIAASMLLACSAYWPLASSFRYSSNDFAASARLPWFTLAIPSQ
jgi:hypothetical protein